MTDAGNPGNTGEVLGLTADSVAQGIGLRLLFNGNPIRFGPPGGGVGNPARWSAGLAAQGPFNIPMVAQVIRTGEVTVGPFKAEAGFVIDYL